VSIGWLGSSTGFVAERPVICQRAEIDLGGSPWKKAPEFRLLGEVLEDFLFSPVTQPALLVCVPVRVFPGDGETTALDVAIVREYHEGSRFEPGMEHVEKPAQWFASRPCDHQEPANAAVKTPVIPVRAKVSSRSRVTFR
jgi:hypothetical protein